MARYGLDYYSASDFPLSYYGSDNPLNYDATPITTLASGYGKITMQWVTPQGPWVNMRIIRSPYGYPVNITDGEVVFETSRRSDPTVYTDEPNHPFTKFFYYSIFVFDSVQLTWILAGKTAGLNVRNYGTAEKLYNYLPQIYKITTPYIPSEPTDNEDLRSFLNLFGFYFDQIRATTELVKDRYNFENVTGATIPLILTQFGIKYEPEVGYQQNRILVRDSVQLSKEKGSEQGLREFIKAFTGWACPRSSVSVPNPTLDGIQIGHNLMLDYNDSSFEEGIGHWVSGDGTGALSQMGQKKVKSYLVNNNTLRMIVGANGYKVGDQVTLSGFKVYGYNSTAPLAVIGVDPLSYVEVSRTAPNVAIMSAFNEDTGEYPILYPYPAPHVEASAPALYPNKQKGILSVANNTGSAQAITITCGSAAPVTLGIPVNSGDTYTFSVYSAALSTARSFTAGISWYDRFGVFMSTSTGTPVTNSTGALSTRGTVTAAAPAAITLNPFFATAGSGYTDGVYTNVPLTYVSGKQFSIAPLANIAISGGSVSSVSIVNGGKGSDTTTIFSFNKASIGSPGGSGFLATVSRVQESYYAAPTIVISGVANAASGERHYFDAAQFEKANTVTSFDEARQVHITMKATRINELKNPSFFNISNFSPWGFTNATKAATTSLTNPIADDFVIEGYQQIGTTATISLSTVHAFTVGDTVVVSGLPAQYNGLKTVTDYTDFTIDYTVSPSATTNFTLANGHVALSGEACVVTKSNASEVEVKGAASSADYIDIHYPETFYNFSIYATKGTGATNPTVKGKIYWYNSSNTLISSEESDLYTLSSSTSWTRVQVKSLAPVNAAYANVSLVWTNGATNDTIALDDALFENTPFALPYFDGSQGFSTTSELFWEGGNSGQGRSHYYKNRVAVQDRLLKGALDEWLISGSTYALYLAQPNT